MDSSSRLQDENDKGLKILVVDDDDLNQRLLNLVLGRDNNSVSFSYNGYDAIKILEQEDFDLIFMDIQIPRINGFEVCEHVRGGNTANRNTPIIALTALPSRDEKMQEFLDAGMFTECIHKPFDAQKIQETLVAVAEKKEFGSRRPQFESEVPPKRKLVLNVEKVMPIFSNDMDLYRELFEDFFAALPERIAKIKQSVAVGDWKNLSVHAHNLTGITRNFGAEKLSSLAEELDEKASQEDSDFVRRLVEEIVKCVPELEEAYSSLTKKDSM